MDAGNAPVRRARTELHTDDIDIVQKPIISSRDELLEEVVIAPEVLHAEHLANLAFAEQPVKIRIERSGEKFAPRLIDVWVNGRGAEIIINGKWVETRVLPVGVPVWTKRKYVEVLARSKIDSINTRSGKVDDNSERNDIERSTSSRAPFSVIEDRDPRGAAWLTGLVSFA